MTAEKIPQDRLGDVLMKQNKLAPHQIGVALDVQRKTRLPLGQILVEANIVSRAALQLALFRQKLSRLLSFNRKPRVGLYGIELVTWAKARLERHLKTMPEQPVVSAEVAEVMKLRSELAGLKPDHASRIVEKDDVLKERLLTGNF